MSVYYHETDFIPSTFFYYYISKDRKVNIVTTKQNFSPYCVKQMEKNSHYQTNNDLLDDQ